MGVCLIMLKCERLGCSESSFIVFLNQLGVPTDPDKTVPEAEPLHCGCSATA